MTQRTLGRMTDVELFEEGASMARRLGAWELTAQYTARVRAARAACAQHVFRLERGGVFTLDGVPVPKRAGSRGLGIAWLVLACHQTRTPMPEASALLTGNHAARRAYEAVQRAAREVAQVSPSASAALHQIGRRGEYLILRRPVCVRCDIAPALLHLFARLPHD